ncbi:hypothetical protein D5F95_11410 [Streptococcus agalactiae]|nr:hypothetical protein D5F95_11410 [Streptococcus agalactiae]RRA93286.1 hypothetical protein D5F93_11960 [Streptococcus agalactiae]
MLVSLTYLLLSIIAKYETITILICKIKLDRKKPFMLGSDKHHICLKGTNINDLYPSYHK